MRAFALVVVLVVLTGVAAATPVAVLRIEPGGRTYALGDGERYEYSYQQSIYQVPVIEEHQRVGDTLRILRVRSRDLRAVDVFCCVAHVCHHRVVAHHAAKTLETSIIWRVR